MGFQIEASVFGFRISVTEYFKCFLFFDFGTRVFIYDENDPKTKPPEIRNPKSQPFILQKTSHQSRKRPKDQNDS